jgi:hypothetical protein
MIRSLTIEEEEDMMMIEGEMTEEEEIEIEIVIEIEEIEIEIDMIETDQEILIEEEEIEIEIDLETDKMKEEMMISEDRDPALLHPRNLPNLQFAPSLQHLLVLLKVPTKLRTQIITKAPRIMDLIKID